MKQIKDIVFHELDNMDKFYKNDNSSYKPIVARRYPEDSKSTFTHNRNKGDDGPDYPVGIKIGDTAYCWSRGMKAWLRGTITIILSPELRFGNHKDNYYVAFKSSEHPNRRDHFYTNKVCLYLTPEIHANRKEYFKNHPDIQQMMGLKF
jgi:hypothetical protein